MTLENLLKIRQLASITPSRADILRLLQAAGRNLDDSRVTAISTENRFDAAYKCVMQSALAALHASGYRTSTSVPGHHQTLIQTLPLTVGADPRQVVLLDRLRKQRNVADYSGDPISSTTLASCVQAAEALLRQVKEWLQQHHPELL